MTDQEVDELAEEVIKIYLEHVGSGWSVDVSMNAFRNMSPEQAHRFIRKVLFETSPENFSNEEKEAVTEEAFKALQDNNMDRLMSLMPSEPPEKTE